MGEPPSVKTFYKKHPTLALVVYFLIAGMGWVDNLINLYNKMIPRISSVETSTTTEQKTPATPAPQPPPNTCITGRLPENKSDWNTKLYGQYWKDAYLYPRMWTDPVMWLNKSIRSDFSEVVIEYRIIPNPTTPSINPPSLILELSPSISKEGKGVESAFKLWLPEKNNDNPPQLFGFAKHSEATQQLEREPAETLPSSVKPEKQDNLRIIPEAINGNEITYKFDYSFTSNVSDGVTSYTKMKTVKFPNAITSSATYNFGIGTYAGNKIQILSYRICQ